MPFQFLLVYVFSSQEWFGFRVFKESVLNRNLMFLLVVIGVAVMKLEFNAFLLRFDIFLLVLWIQLCLVLVM